MFGDLVQECYAREHGLDYQAMLSASDYKERYRLAMIEWSEEIRSRDPGYFCRAAIQQYTGGQQGLPAPHYSLAGKLQHFKREDRLRSD